MTVAFVKAALVEVRAFRPKQLPPFHLARHFLDELAYATSAYLEELADSREVRHSQPFAERRRLAGERLIDEIRKFSEGAHLRELCDNMGIDEPPR